MKFLSRASLLVLVFLLAACSRHSASNAPEQGEYSHSELVTQLAAAPAPQGIDAALWQQLKSALAADLDGKARFVRTAPLSDASQSTLSLNVSSLTLTWLYFNQGDYDQNGEANIGDLTPIALHFGENGGGAPFLVKTALSNIDGDGNGEINIADVSPIGVNFGRAALSYNVYRSQNAADIPAENDGPNGPGTELLGNVPLSAATGNSAQQRLSLTFVLPSADLSWFYWVRPNDAADGSGQDGTPSSVVSFGGAITNLPPVAEFTLDPSLAAAPVIVSFDASASSDPDGTNGDISDITQFEWDFDGDQLFDLTTSSPQITHEYPGSGAFAVGLRVLDAGGAFATTSHLLSVSGVFNSAPIVTLSVAPDSGDVPFDVTLTADAADDGGAANLSFDWDFDGDGIFDQNSGSTPEVVHNYNTVGEFNATVRVRDTSFDEDSATATVTAEAAGNQAPDAVLAPDTENGAAPLSVAFDPSQSSDADGNIVLYRWDFNGDGLFDHVTISPTIQNITFGAAGIYTIVLEVLDNQAGKDSAISTVEVTGGWQINTIRPLGTDEILSDIAIAPFNKANAQDSRLHVAYSLEDRSIRAIHSSDNLGESWDTSSDVVVTFKGSRTHNGTLHLGVVAGLPAIAFIDDQGGRLQYVRAADQAGESWGNSFTIGAQGDGSGPSLSIVEGNPAVAWMETSNAEAQTRYSRSLTSTGQGSWTSHVIAMSAAKSSAEFPRAVLGVTSTGDPAIISNNLALLAVRAKDKFGEEWETGTHFVVSNDALSFGAAYEASDSGIAIAIGLDTDDSRQLIAATTENAFGAGAGNNWDDSVTIVPFRTLGEQVVFHRHGSKAAVLFINTSNNSLNFVQSTSGTGLTWGAPQIIDFGVDTEVFDFIQIGSSLVAVYYQNSSSTLKSATLE